MLKQLFRGVCFLFLPIGMSACQMIKSTTTPMPPRGPEYSEAQLDFSRGPWDGATCCTATGKKIAVAGAGPQSTRAALEIYGRGGNIIDAAVAALFVTSVESERSALLGGGGFITLHFKGQDYFVDFRESAPRKSKADMFLNEKGDVIPKLSSEGALAVATPGFTAGLYDLHRRWGKLNWKQVLSPAINLAQTGNLPNQKYLATTLRLLAAKGKSPFYTGTLAKKITALIKSKGGILDEKDLERYHVRFREPLVAKFKEFTIVTAPPESAGGTLFLEMLNVLGGFDISAEANSPGRYFQLLAEVQKRAYSDRPGLFADPDFVTTPYTKLLSPEYAETVRKTINLTHATSSSSLSPPISLLPQEAGGNAQLSILDAEGNGLSATVSNDFSSSGPGLLVPETGIVLNNTMDDFSAKPGEKNIYGLSGNEGNAVAAKKRPSSSLMPTLIFKSGRPVLALGAGGGPSAISAMLNVTLNVLFIYKDDLKKSVFAPRVYHGWWPDKLEVEAGVGDSTRAELKNFGHEIIPMSTKEMATVEAVSYDAKSGRLTAVFDPRSSGGADAR